MIDCLEKLTRCINVTLNYVTPETGGWRDGPFEVYGG